MKRLLYSSDLDLKGSGYLNITIPLLSGLVSRYDWDVKVLGLGYDGREHTYPFSIIPTRGFKEQQSMLHDLHHLWKPDVFCMAMDIPIHKRTMDFMSLRKLQIPYIGIFPLESTPLIFNWSMVVSAMQGSMCISKFGTAACKEKDLDTKYFEVGLGKDFWTFPDNESRKTSRNVLGVDDDTFIVLTVADNQERKNLPKVFETISEFKKLTPKVSVKLLLVTREHLSVGYDIMDLSQRYGLNNDVMVFERGISSTELKNIYDTANIFLMTPKAEGLCMPALEAMSCGIPVVATNIGAFPEHLSDGRGYLVDPEYVYVDVYGNADRAFFDAKAGARVLKKEYEYFRKGKQSPVICPAKEYVDNRNWDTTVDTFVELLEEVSGG